MSSIFSCQSQISEIESTKITDHPNCKMIDLSTTLWPFWSLEKFCNCVVFLILVWGWVWAAGLSASRWFVQLGSGMLSSSMDGLLLHLENLWFIFLIVRTSYILWKKILIQYISAWANICPCYNCILHRPFTFYSFQQGREGDAWPHIHMCFMFKRAPQCPLLLQVISKGHLPSKVMYVLKPERTTQKIQKQTNKQKRQVDFPVSMQSYNCTF